jgi:excisionase family DNA binding protein
MKNSSTKINANGVPVGYFRRASAARYCGISLRTLGEFQRRRILPYVRLGRRCILFKREDLDRALERFRVAAIGEN